MLSPKTGGKNRPIRYFIYFFVGAVILTMSNTVGAVPAREMTSTAPQIAVITATQDDALMTDGDGDGAVDPGDVLVYTVHIQNLGSSDATTVSFSDTIDSNTTSVAGSLRTTPIARNDIYAATGNVSISVPNGASDLFANDNDPDNTGAVSLVTFDAAGISGGAVVVNADGSFTYDPPPGFVGTDIFTYTIQDIDGNQDMARVFITVNDMIWFIDNSLGTAGDGRLSAPFNTLAAFEAVNGSGGANPKAGDTIFIYTGSSNYTAPLTLENSQILIGQGATDTLANISGITLAAYSDPLPTTNGTSPVLENASGNGIVLAAGNTLRGLNVGNTASASGAGIAGTSVGNLAINDVSISGTGKAFDVNGGGTVAITLDSVAVTSSTNGGFSLQGVSGTTTIPSLNLTTTGGTGFFASNAGTVNVTTGNINAGSATAVDIDNTALGITLFSVRSSGGSTPGIDLSTTTGSFTVTGDGATAGSGGTASSKTGDVDGVLLINTTNVSLAYMTISNNSRNGLFGQTVNGLTLTGVTLNGNADQASPDEAGLLLLEVTGTVNVVNTTISNSYEHNVKVLNSTGTLTAFNVTGSTIGPNPGGTGAQGLLFQGMGAANMALTVTGSTFTGNQSNGIFADTAGGTMNVTVQSSAFVNNNVGIGVSASSSGNMSFDILNNIPIHSTTASQSIGINVFANASHTGTIQGTISGNRIGTNGIVASGSIDGNGISASNEGAGTMTLLVDNNTVQEVGNGSFTGFEGIFIIDSVTAGTLNATVTNNIVDQIRDDRGLQIRLTSGGTVCADISGNAFSNTGGSTDLRVSHTSGTYNLRQTSQANLSTVNGGATTTVSGAITFGGSACTQPTLMRPVAAVDTAVSQPHLIQDVPQPAHDRVVLVELPTKPEALAKQVEAPLSGETVNVALGTMNAGQTLTIIYQVTVDDPVDVDKLVLSNQGTVLGDNFANVNTDDPDTGTAADATLTPLDTKLIFASPDAPTCATNRPCLTGATAVQAALNNVAADGTVFVLGAHSTGSSLACTVNTILVSDLSGSITWSAGAGSLFSNGSCNLTVKGLTVNGGGTATIFNQSSSGDLLAYANNITNFNADLTYSGSGTTDLRHNWWGSGLPAPSGVSGDALAYRLGAAASSFADGAVSVSLADGTAGANATLAGAGGGILAIVNHGTTAPFGKGIPADTGANQCADIYDFFVIGGSGNYTVSLPIKGACQGVVDDKLFQFNLIGGAPNTACTPDTACWDALVLSAGQAGSSVTASVSAANLQGTPFAAPSVNNNDPTAVSLQSMTATMLDTSWLPLLFALFVCSLLVFVRFRRSAR